MTTIKASLFKATCLALMDRVNETGEEIIITKNGRPVSRLLPYRDRSVTLFGLHAHQVHLADDLIAPLNDSWDADRE